MRPGCARASAISSGRVRAGTAGCTHDIQRIRRNQPERREGTFVVVGNLHQVRRHGVGGVRADQQRGAWSGRARATARCPTVPEAPPRLSTTTGWPSSADRRGASTRTTVSVEPPAAQGTTMVMNAAAGRRRALRGGTAGGADGEGSGERRAPGDGACGHGCPPCGRCPGGPGLVVAGRIWRRRGRFQGKAGALPPSPRRGDSVTPDPAEI